MDPVKNVGRILPGSLRDDVRASAFSWVLGRRWLLVKQVSIRKARRRLAAGVLVAVLGLVLAWIISPGRKGSASRVSNDLSPISSDAASPPLAGERAKDEESGKEDGIFAGRSLGEEIEATEELIGSGIPPDETHRHLRRLRRSLNRARTEEASDAICAYLDSGRDVATRLGFAVGRSHSLRYAPTLRVFLLDALGYIDVDKADAYANGVFAARESPDEWAVSIRNTVWARSVASGNLHESDRSYVLARVREMIHVRDWMNGPSAGLLEAFDTIVHLGADGFVPELARLIEPEQPKSVQYAAYLALDRLVLADPARILAQLARVPDLLDHRPETRAGFFARVNVGDPGQRAIAEKYIFEIADSEAELERFFGLFPNQNMMLSHRLLSSNPSSKPDRILHRLESTTRVLNLWFEDERFMRIRNVIQGAQLRLAEHMES